MKIKKAILFVALTGVLTLGAAAPSFAVTPTPPAPLPGASSAQHTAVLAELNTLSGTQSASEIDAIRNSGQPAELLFDPITNKYVSAVLVPAPTFSTQAITVSGPGCSATTACLRNTSNTPYGYNGTGSLNVNHPNITYVAAGSILTTFWRNASTGEYVSPNQSINYSSPVTIVKLTRGG